MNERIRELAKQAGYVPLEPRTFADDLQEIFLKKFAELIAAEERKACAQIAENGLIGHTIAKAIRARGDT